MVVAYLGFHKGGPKLSLANCAHTKGAKPCFPIFSYGEKMFLLKGGHGPMAPLNMPLDDGDWMEIK